MLLSFFSFIHFMHIHSILAHYYSDVLTIGPIKLDYPEIIGYQAKHAITLKLFYKLKHAKT